MQRSLLAVILGAVLVSSSALAQVGASSGAISSSASPPSPSLGPGQGTTPVGTSGGPIRDIGAGRGVLSPRASAKPAPHAYSERHTIIAGSRSGVRCSGIRYSAQARSEMRP